MTAQTPIHILEVDLVDNKPMPEQIQLLAADYITRVLALTQQNKPRQALVRVAQLNALVLEFPLLAKAYPGLPVFVRYGTHYCAGTRVKASAMFLLSQKAAPILHRMSASVSEYLSEQARDEAEAAAAARRAPKPATPKMQRLGNSLAVLDKVLPKVLDEAKLRAAAYQERQASKSSAVVSATDAFIIDQANSAQVRELCIGESATVRAAIVLPDAYVSKLAHKSMCVEYGMHKVMGSYWIMTDALLVGVARRDAYGDARPEDDIQQSLDEVLRLRNNARAGVGRDAYAVVGTAVSSGSHRYFLLFDSSHVTDGQVVVRRWSFFRMPGTSEIKIHEEGTE